LADAVVLVQTPMAGDDVQAAKAGINEIGDIYVVNKCDHNEAERMVRFLQDMIALDHHLHPEKIWVPPVLKTQAISGLGFDKLIEQIEKYFSVLNPQSPEMHRRRRRRVFYQTKNILHAILENRFHEKNDGHVESGIESILLRESDPYSLALKLLGAQN
jgi:LAO/AO transport system kinase